MPLWKRIASYALIACCAVVLGWQIPKAVNEMSLGSLFRLVMLPGSVFVAGLVILHANLLPVGGLRPRVAVTGIAVTPPRIAAFCLLLAAAVAVGLFLCMYGSMLGLLYGPVLLTVAVMCCCSLYLTAVGKCPQALALFLLALPLVTFVEYDLGPVAAAAPLSGGGFSPEGIEGALLYFLAMFLVWITRRLTHKEPLVERSWTYVPLLLVLTCTFASIVVLSHDKQSALGSAIRVLVWPSLVFLFVAETVRTKEDLSVIVHGLVVSGVLYSFMAFYLVYRVKGILPLAGAEAYYGQLYYLSGSNSLNAQVMAVVLPVAFSLHLGARHKRTALVFAGLVCYLVLGQFFTFLRGTLVAALAGLSVFLGSRRLQLSFLLAVILMFIFSDVVFTFFLERFQNVRSFGDLLDLRTLSHNRYLAWQSAWNMFRDYPFFGVGYENITDYQPRYIPPMLLVEYGRAAYVYRGDTHNVFLNLLAGMGGAGFVLWAWFLGMLFLKLLAALRAAPVAPLRHIVLGLLGSLVTILAVAMTQQSFLRSNMFYSVLRFLVWTLFGLAVAARAVVRDSARAGAPES